MNSNTKTLIFIHITSILSEVIYACGAIWLIILKHYTQPFNDGVVLYAAAWLFMVCVEFIAQEAIDLYNEDVNQNEVIIARPLCSISMKDLDKISIVVRSGMIALSFILMIYRISLIYWYIN